MDIIKIAAIAVVAVAFILLVRQLKPEFASVATVGASVVLLSIIANKAFDAIYTIYNLSERALVDKKAISCVIKVVGIGYIGEFSNNICVDAGCKSIGDKVLLGAKVAIVLCIFPVVEELFGILQNMLLS